MKNLIKLFFLIAINYTFAQITDTGDKVGVGTSNPDSSKLHIVGDYNLRIDPSQGAIPYYYISSNSANNIIGTNIRTKYGTWNVPSITEPSSYIDFDTYNVGGNPTYGGISFLTRAAGSTSNTGSVKMLVSNNGNVGIGTTNPSEKLDVNGAILARNGGFNTSITGTQFLMGYNGDSTYKHAIKTRHHAAQDAQNAIDFYVWDFGTDAISDEPTKLVMTIDGANTGNVGIGTIDTKGFKLGVQGKIAAEEVKVAMYSNWADFVFESNYTLPSLKEVEQHIKEKGHLKDIPSAEDVKENGIFLGEMDSKLLQKIEELTLYAIQQEKEIIYLQVKASKVDTLVKELQNQKVINNNLETRLQRIETLFNSNKQ